MIVIIISYLVFYFIQVILGVFLVLVNVLVYIGMGINMNKRLKERKLLADIIRDEEPQLYKEIEERANRNENVKL